MSYKTVFKTDRFELYTDNNGKFWLWDDWDECNRAIRAKSEIDAYRESIQMLIFSCKMYKDSRDELRERMGKIEKTFSEVFPEYVLE